MDLKGEPQTLEQQSELRLYYTDHPLKPGFSKRSGPLAFNNLETDFLPFPKRTKWNHIQSKNVQKEETFKILETSFHIFHVQENIYVNTWVLLLFHIQYTALRHFPFVGGNEWPEQGHMCL